MTSPFNRNTATLRTPPPSPAPPAPAPRAPEPQHQPQPQQDEELSVVPTEEIQTFLTRIDQCLNQVCAIASEGKLNSEQKLKINNLCRNIALGTSQMVVQYQSVKQKALLAHARVQELQENFDISNTLNEIQTSIKKACSNQNVSSTSFADVVKKTLTLYILDLLNRVRLRFIQVINQNLVRIQKSWYGKLFFPEKMKMHVKGVRKTRNGGVIISTETKDDIEKLKNASQLVSSGLSVEEPSKRNPRLIVLGVPTASIEKEFFSLLYEQNLADKLPNESQEVTMSSIKLSHKSGKKDSLTCNFVIEVPAYIRKILISQQRVYINWSSHLVRDFTLVTRCYKCQQYGHAAKTCRETTPTCYNCGEQGHAGESECPNKCGTPKCATCVRYKKLYDHDTGSVSCPARQFTENNYINSIDYMDCSCVI